MTTPEAHMPHPLPVLYSFRRCPYAMRARLALRVAGQAVEHREIELKTKPAAMLQASPKGTVPVLVLTDGSVLEQSLDIMRWALERQDPDAWLPADEPSRQDAWTVATLEHSHILTALAQWLANFEASEAFAQVMEKHPVWPGVAVDLAPAR